MKLGFTFSNKYCDELGLDWEKTLCTLVKDFSPQVIRLCAYWDEINPEPDIFDYELLDKQLNICLDHKVEVVMAVGRKVPRWPEFHEPEWAKSLPIDTRLRLTEKYIARTINRYDMFPLVTKWQIENEPFFVFGTSDLKVSKAQFEKEIRLARRLTAKQLVTSTSSELKDWDNETKYIDQLGINVYQKVYESKSEQYREINQTSDTLNKKIKKNQKPVLIAELQAEPWGPDENAKFDYSIGEESMNPALLRKNFDLVKELEIGEIYFWGAEWWCLMDSKEHPEIYQTAKNIFKII